MSYQETIAQLLNRCANKLSADDYGALQNLLQQFGYDPDDVEGEDDEPTLLTPQQSNELLDFLSSRFGVDEIQGIVNSLGEITKIPTDDPLPFSARPSDIVKDAQDAAKKKWKVLAMDRALHGKPAQEADSFFTRFPSAARIQTEAPAALPRKGKMAHPTHESRDAFLARFPDAARIKIGGQ